VLLVYANYNMDIIGLDLDGVLSNTGIVIEKFLAEEFNITPDWDSVEHYILDKMDFMTEEALEAFLKCLYDGSLFEKAEPHNYAEHSTKKLRNQGFKIAILTSRKAKLKAMTMDWLDKHDIVYDLVYMIHSSKKHELIKTLDIKAFVEDRFDTLESIIQNHKPLDLGLYVVTEPHNRRFNNEHIIRVPDVSVAVDRIIDYRKWRGFFLTKCQGNVEKFIKEYQDGTHTV